MGTLRVDNIQSAAGVRGLIGITDGANAATGVVGEVLASTLAASTLITNNPVSGTWYAASAWALSIPAGDWDLHLNANISGTGAAGGQGWVASISLTPTTSASVIYGGAAYGGAQFTGTTGEFFTGAHLYARWNTSVGSTLYPAARYELFGSSVALSALSWWAETTTNYNLLSARRMR